MTRPLITIDPGHPSRDGDRGTCHGDLVESEVTWDMACRVNTRLLNLQGYDTRFTRNAVDEVAHLKTRGLRVGSDTSLCVSIHVNASTDPAVYGTMVFVPEDQPLLDVSIARAVLEALPKCMIHPKRSLRPVRAMAATWPRVKNVLDFYHCPKFMIECGFATNEKDRGFLMTDTVRDQIADAIVAGVKAGFPV